MQQIPVGENVRWQKQKQIILKTKGLIQLIKRKIERKKLGDENSYLRNKCHELTLRVAELEKSSIKAMQELAGTADAIVGALAEKYGEPITGEETEADVVVGYRLEIPKPEYGKFKIETKKNDETYMIGAILTNDVLDGTAAESAEESAGSNGEKTE